MKTIIKINNQINHLKAFGTLLKSLAFNSEICVVKSHNNHVKVNVAKIAIINRIKIIIFIKSFESIIYLLYNKNILAIANRNIAIIK